MRIDLKFSVGDNIIETATKIRGRIVTAGADEIGHLYECAFEQSMQGRRRHWKRESEIKLAPKPKKAKTRKA